MEWTERMAQCKAWQKECPPEEQEPEVPEWVGKSWPWQQLEALAGKLSTELAEGVEQIMAEAGESGEQLTAIRRSQVAYSIWTRAEREFKAARS